MENLSKRKARLLKKTKERDELIERLEKMVDAKKFQESVRKSILDWHNSK